MLIHYQVSYDLEALEAVFQSSLTQSVIAKLILPWREKKKICFVFCLEYVLKMRVDDVENEEFHSLKIS